MEELDARIRALIRRKPREEGALEQFGSLSFDKTGRRLFECFFDRAGQIVPKAVLANHLYGVGSDIEEKVVEVYISRLRKRLAPHGVEFKVARGIGYMMKHS